MKDSSDLIDVEERKEARKNFTKFKKNFFFLKSEWKEMRERERERESYKERERGNNLK